ncbi:MAG: hypothetical protein ABI834_06570, partial [Ginsengibacter sp.]
TTCSSSFAAEPCNIIARLERPAKAIVCDIKPRDDTTNVAVGLLTLKEKLPEASVAVPAAVPFSWTVTPATGAPSEPVTFPVTVVAWAKTSEGIKKLTTKTKGRK